VRQYARFLRLDEDELAAEVEKVVNPVVDLPSFTSAAPQPVFKVPRMVEWEGAGSSNSSVLSALALVVAVMLVCSAVYAWWQRSRRPALSTQPVTAAQARASVPKPAEPPTVTPAVAHSPETATRTDVSTPAPPSENAAASQEAPAASAQEASTAQQKAAPAPPASLNPAAALQISLAADQEAWVQVWADGKCVEVGVLPPNTVRTVAADQTVRIRTGNAGDLQLTVNGKPAGPLGPKGQIREIQVTREGVHILPPPPKPAPAPELAPASAPEPL
jgi:cytoskeletal protein RodZ